MELPHLGEHCSDSSCKRLDFLPMTCDACQKTFCGDHVTYSSHNCTESYKKDNQVPACPLCSAPIPVKPGETPDIVVGRHIDTDCQSDPAKEKRQVYTNKCSAKGCKNKELIPVICEKCRKNFCLRHRHELDHSCKGFEGSGKSVSNSGAAALSRFNFFSSSNTNTKTKTNSKPQQSSLSNIGRDLNRERQSRQQRGVPMTTQAGMSEDEALARALQMSMAESSGTKTQPTSNQTGSLSQEEEDLMLARALQESEQEARNQTQRTENKEKFCMLS
ncbi:AN1-type zinc finger protein 2A [Patella vulgata]|uniref:AN1-type zinc finger protein 2A n=1 Tax=Patella vulgata TaxID=6465 RepID=UPI0021806C40|nr:AN1-type zinc finger protein 2A [Patella vulgata]